MSVNQKKLEFSRLYKLNRENISDLSMQASLYMICKVNNNGSNEVIFAGVGSNLQQELASFLDNNLNADSLYFCYIPTSAKNVLKNSKAPLYQRVA